MNTAYYKYGTAIAVATIVAALIAAAASPTRPRAEATKPKADNASLQQRFQLHSLPPMSENAAVMPDNADAIPKIRTIPIYRKIEDRVPAEPPPPPPVKQAATIEPLPPQVEPPPQQQQIDVCSRTGGRKVMSKHGRSWRCHYVRR